MAAHVSGGPTNPFHASQKEWGRPSWRRAAQQPSKHLQPAPVQHSHRAGPTLYSFLRLTKGLLALLCQM